MVRMTAGYLQCCKGEEDFPGIAPPRNTPAGTTTLCASCSWRGGVEVFPRAVINMHRHHLLLIHTCTTCAYVSKGIRVIR